MADVRKHYRSGIYYLNDSPTRRRRAALAAAWPGIARHRDQVTGRIHRFYPAESEHDDYFRLHPYQGYCQLIVAPKSLREGNAVDKLMSRRSLR